MKVISPSFEILHFDDDAIEKICIAARTCYKSEPKDEKSNENLVKKLIASGHHTPLEMTTSTVRIITDRGVLAELTRHRLASFCLSGDTKILRYQQNRGHLTIKELYERQQDGQKHGRNKLMTLRSMDANGNILPNKFKQIIFSGIKDVYQVETSLGYKIKCSKDHVFFTPNGEQKLRDLNINDSLFVNGRPSLVKVTDEELSRLYNQLEMSIPEISQHLEISTHLTRLHLKRIGVFQKHKNDKNKEKYNKNHTKESVEKMRQTILEQYRNGRSVWNTGLSANDDSRIKAMVAKLKKHHYHPSLKADKNPNWKGDKCTIHAKRNRFVKYQKEKCELCGLTTRLENHHKDKNPENWREENKQTLCVACHKLLHKGYNVKKVIPDNIISITYIGKEETYDIEMLPPYHNFVADGFVVHNSVESTRYNNYSKDKFGSEITFIRPCFWIFEPINTLQYDKWANGELSQYQLWLNAMQHAENTYLQLIKSGATPQEARSVLPMSLKTEIICSCNLRELRHILDLRCSAKAHPQIRELCLPLLKEVYARCPVIFEDIYLKYCSK